MVSFEEVEPRLLPEIERSTQPVLEMRGLQAVEGPRRSEIPHPFSSEETPVPGGLNQTPVLSGDNQLSRGI